MSRAGSRAEVEGGPRGLTSARILEVAIALADAT